MPFLVLGIIAVAATGWTVNEVGNAAEKSTKLVRWATIGGGIYVAYRAAKSAKVIK